MERLQDRVAIITGAAQGIGAAYARAMAQEGATVIIADLDDGEEIAKEIRENGGKALNVVTNVSNELSVESLVSTTVEQY